MRRSRHRCLRRRPLSLHAAAVLWAASWVALLAPMMGSAPSPALAQGSGGGGGTLRIGLREDPDVLDPTLGSSYVGRIVYAAMCDKLFDIDSKLAIVPQLATGYEYADPTHLVIRLREGVRFHDGEAMDAEAVKTSLLRHLTAKGSMRAGEINAIQSVEVVDPLTVRLVLKAPSASLVAALADRAGIVMSPKALAGAGGDQFGQRPVCAGPFAFDSRVQQDRIVLKRFLGYWNAGAIHFDQVIYQPIPDASVRVANLQAGSLDIVEQILPSDADRVRNDPRLKLMVGDGLAYTGITFNTGNNARDGSAVAKSALVRRAFELALDRQALVQVVYNGEYVPVAQANTPSSPLFVPEIQPPARDVEAAKALLRQAGVSLPVPVTLTVTTNSDSRQAGEVVQAMAQEAGFDVRLQATEFASSLQAAYAGNFEAYLIAWSGRVDADANMWQFLHTGGTFNYGHYSDPEMDRLLDAGRQTTDPAERRRLYTQVWQKQRQDMPLVYLYIARNLVGMKRGLTGFTQVPDGMIRLQGVMLAR